MTDHLSSRVELSQPAPMLPPMPAIILGVKGDETIRDDLSCVWTFVLDGYPPQVGISVAQKSGNLRSTFRILPGWRLMILLT